MDGNIIAAIIAVHMATNATNDIPMVPAPLPIARTWSSVTTQASAVSARSGPRRSRFAKRKQNPVRKMVHVHVKRCIRLRRKMRSNPRAGIANRAASPRICRCSRCDRPSAPKGCPSRSADAAYGRLTVAWNREMTPHCELHSGGVGHRPAAAGKGADIELDGAGWMLPCRLFHCLVSIEIGSLANDNAISGTLSLPRTTRSPGTRS
jgi:hypothetical protein